MDKKYYVIGGQKFYVREKVSLKQYRKLAELIGAINISIKDNEFGNTWVMFVTMFMAIFSIGETSIIQTLLSYIVLAEGQEEWSDEKAKENSIILEEISDKDFMEIITDFLAGRRALIMSLVESFTKQMKNTEE